MIGDFIITCQLIYVKENSIHQDIIFYIYLTPFLSLLKYRFFLNIVMVAPQTRAVDKVILHYVEYLVPTMLVFLVD